VANAREHGWSWQEIAEVLGVSRQAVHKKHANRADEARGGPAAALRDRLTRGGTRNA
jgi:DNA-directed RNA polymerase specialized sigma24 family protein